jgi:uncharacterized membrane protein
MRSNVRALARSSTPENLRATCTLCEAGLLRLARIIFSVLVVVLVVVLAVVAVVVGGACFVFVVAVVFRVDVVAVIIGAGFLRALRLAAVLVVPPVIVAAVVTFGTSVLFLVLLLVAIVVAVIVRACGGRLTRKRSEQMREARSTEIQAHDCPLCVSGIERFKQRGECFVG